MLTWEHMHFEDDLGKCWWHLKDPQIENVGADLLTCHVSAQADVTARNDLDWLQPEIQRIGDWIEQQGHVAAGYNGVPTQTCKIARRIWQHGAETAVPSLWGWRNRVTPLCGAPSPPPTPVIMTMLLTGLKSNTL